MNSVSRPRLLDGNMAVKAVLHPHSLRITFNLLDAHTAQMKLGENDTTPTMHDLVELFTIKGSAGLFRVTNIAHTLNGDVEVQMRHVIDTLTDGIWPAEEDYDGTVPAYMAKLIDYQPHKWWKLGACDDTAAFAREAINYNQLSDMLASLLDDRGAIYPTYDLSTSPWTLNIRTFPPDVKGEFRLSRNINSCRITRDDSDMANRVYVSWDTDSDSTPDVYNDAASQAIYGVVAKAVTMIDQTVKDKAAWAKWYFDRYSMPSLQISIDGQELKKLTGEAWDEYSVGSLVRVALPDYGETYQERCVSVDYPDVLGQPYNVTVQLANRQDKFSGAISSIKKTVSGAGGGGGSTDTNSLARTSSGASRASAANKTMLQGIHSVVYGDGTGENAGLITQVEQNSKQILLRAYQKDLDETNGKVTTNTAQIEVNAQAIKAEVARATEAEGDLSSSITVEAGRITSEVTARKDADTALSSRITQTADAIALVVDSGTDTIKAASIVAAINQSGSSVVISADHINLDGYVTASELATTNAKISNLITGTTVATALKADLLQANSTFNVAGSNYAGRVLKMGSTTSATVLSTANAQIDFDHSHVIEAAAGDDGKVTITLKKTQLNDGTCSFSIADTTFYKNGVSAAKDEGLKSATVSIGSWAKDDTGYRVPVYATGKLQNGSTWTSTAKYVSMPSLNISGSINSGTSYTYTINASDGDTVVATNSAFYAVAAYNNGWSAAAGKVSGPGTGTSSTMSVTVPSSATVGSTSSLTYTLSCMTNYAYIKDSNDYVVARVENPVKASTLGTKTITSNGTYNASSDSYDGYSKVTVNVPVNTLTTKSIQSNGVYKATSDGYDGYSLVTVSVPTTSYSSSDLHISRTGTGYVYLYLTGGSPNRSCPIVCTNIRRSSTVSTLFYVTVRIDGDTDFSLTYSGSL